MNPIRYEIVGGRRGAVAELQRAFDEFCYLHKVRTISPKALAKIKDIFYKADVADNGTHPLLSLWVLHGRGDKILPFFHACSKAALK